MIRTLPVILFAWIFPTLIHAQLSTETMDHDGIERSFLRYVPEDYDGSEAYPVVFCLHGLGDNMINFYSIGMNNVADTAHFIVITPQALVDPTLSASAWNSGAGAFGISPNPGIDDVGFISAIIDELAAEFNIDLTRIYSCGFSMGGFMTNRLGCELNDRLAAIASVAGTIGGVLNCNPGGGQLPMCHFHGTQDEVVGYSNNFFGTSAEATVAFWAANNGCDAGPEVSQVPDAYNDGLTAEHWIYNGCNNNADVEFWKINNAYHVWLSALNDVDYTKEIWRFFRRYTLNQANIVTEENEEEWVRAYPVPATERLMVSAGATMDCVSLYDLAGRIVLRAKPNTMYMELDVQALSGYYVLEVFSGSKSVKQKVIIQ